jgi:hypothetical protein
VVILLLCLLPSSALADKSDAPASPESAPDDELGAVWLEAGKAAPYTGQLLTVPLALEYATDDCPERLEAEEKRRVDHVARERTRGERLLQSSEEASKRKAAIDAEALSRATAFHRQFWFGALIGSLLTSGVWLLSAVAQGEIAKNNRVPSGATP